MATMTYKMIWMIFVIYACNVVLAEDDCTIPKEKKFKDLNSRGKKSYPREAVETAFGEYPAIKEAVSREADTESDDKDPNAGNDVDIVNWNLPCPYKMKNAQYYSVKDKKKLCWVLTPIWIAQCSKKTCEYTFVSQAYYQCRPRYIAVQFWAFCPEHSDVPFKLLRRFVPKYCECRRYVCRIEANPFPVEPVIPPPEE